MNDLTYHLLSYTWWEPHLIAWLHFVEEVGPALQEAEHCVKQTVNSLPRLLCDREQQVIVPLIYTTCSAHFTLL